MTIQAIDTQILAHFQPGKSDQSPLLFGNLKKMWREIGQKWAKNGQKPTFVLKVARKVGRKMG